MTTETKGFTIEEVCDQQKAEKLLKIKEDFKNDPDRAIKCIFNLSNSLDSLSADYHRLWKENRRLEGEVNKLSAETAAKDEHIEELKAELEEVKYELEEIKDENKDLQEQLEELPARDYYDEIGMSEADF